MGKEKNEQPRDRKKMKKTMTVQIFLYSAKCPPCQYRFENTLAASRTNSFRHSNDIKTEKWTLIYWYQVTLCLKPL